MKLLLLAGQKHQILHEATLGHIDGLGHKPSNSEFSTNLFSHKMTRDQVIHHV